MIVSSTLVHGCENNEVMHSTCSNNKFPYIFLFNDIYLTDRHASGWGKRIQVGTACGTQVCNVLDNA